MRQAGQIGTNGTTPAVNQSLNTSMWNNLGQVGTKIAKF